MNPDDDDAVINQLKHPKIPLDVIPKVGIDFVRAVENRKYQLNGRPSIDLQTLAEDELIRKEYKELRCEMPGTPRSTFLMVFSPDGTKVASTHGNHNIYVTDLKSGKNIRTLIGHPRTPWCIAFHPTCNELVASGCLGGQVRIWDLSGGSEVWTAGSQTVIASIAFHPSDRILVIATYNELHFWDWSKPQPFKRTTTCNTKEKVRYVAFDKLGHKLITGIANTPQSRWERTRVSTAQNRWDSRIQTTISWERARPQSPSLSPYRRRLTPRLLTSPNYTLLQPATTTANSDRVPLSTVPERERRITACYRNLVHEYELLVHRYLQVYRPPTTMDRGTDPMEVEHQTADTQTPGPSTSSSQATVLDPGPSTSGIQHVASTSSSSERPFRLYTIPLSNVAVTSTQIHQVPSEVSSRRRFIMRTTLGVQTSTDTSAEPSGSSSSKPFRVNYKMRIKCSPRRRSTNSTSLESSTESGSQRLERAEISVPGPSTSSLQDSDLATNVRGLSQSGALPELPADQVIPPSDMSQATSSMLPPSAERTDYSALSQPITQTTPSVSISTPSTDSNELWRLPLKRLYPGFIKKIPKHVRKPIVETSSDNSSSEDEDVVRKRQYTPLISRPCNVAASDAQGKRLDHLNDGAQSSTQVSNTDAAVTLAGGTNSDPCSKTHFRCCNDNRRESSEKACRSSLEKIALLTDFLTKQQGHVGSSTCNRCGGNINSQAESLNTVAVENSGSSTTTISSTSVELTNRTDTVTATSSRSTSTEFDSSVDPLPSASTSNNNENENTNGCARTTEVHVSQPCARTLMNTDTRTTNSTVYTPSSGPRRRFFSHVLSAFLPTRVVPQIRSRRSNSYVPPLSTTRSALDTITRGNNRLSIDLVPDEVINFAERDDYEQPSTLNEFHPFDPPPEFPSINPENIGIGNMYSNIVQDLESSLYNVRNISASNRPGETSDMLSSFSERLESIMHQSDSILRNLRHTMDMLPTGTETIDRGRLQRASPSLQLPSPRNVESADPRFYFNDSNFYIRDQSQNNLAEQNGTSRTEMLDAFNAPNLHEDLDSNRSAIASDHTYPRNLESPRTLPPSSDNLTPLMTSLHLTISHIQRQARLLRRQVESIERIDRAMLEVAQLQMIRQMFGEVRRHLNTLSGSDNRSTGVSSVRQMMAGTRISDSSPCDSPAEDETNRNQLSEQGTSNTFGVRDSSTSSSSVDAASNSSGSQIPRQRATARKSFPPSRLLHIQRQNRRFSVVNFIPRRCSARDRLTRRRVYFRTFAVRANPTRVPGDNVRFPLSDGRIHSSVTHVNNDSLPIMTRRLESLLTEHIRLIGRPEPYPRVPSVNTTDGREDAIVERLNTCRARLNRLSGPIGNDGMNQNGRIELSSVTPDGNSRVNARETLSVVLDLLSRFIYEHTCTTIPQSLRSQMRNVIDLTSLLSDILLLHIVDSIPPPTGMNLDPERESLSTRIDYMCTRMLHNRFGQSHNLTRSLRLMRLTARHAARALGQTYNMRRNAIFSSGNNSRRELLGQINNTLYSIHRNRGISYTPMEIPSNTDPFGPETMPVREWYRTINALVSRYSQQEEDSNINSTSTSLSNGASSSSSSTATNALPINRRLGEGTYFARIGLFSDDDNDDYEPDWYNNNLPNDRRLPLYRTSNVNLLNNEESAPTNTPNRSWNVPTVQINDVPISESSSAWHSRFSQHRYRLSDLRSNSSGSLFRPRFLHPLYAGVNPFDDLDDPQREQIYDGDMILTVTPNHRIQAWDISSGNIPDIGNAMKNIVVSECKIHNDASVDISTDGTILVTLLPSGGYLNVTNRLGIYSLRWETLGQCLYQTSFEQNAVSVSLSPLSRHLVVGLASRRVSIVPNDKWTMARIFLLNQNELPYGGRLSVLRELEQNRDTNYMSLNCIRWLPISGQGLIYATNTGQLRILT